MGAVIGGVLSWAGGGLAKAAAGLWGWLKTIPWYVIALAALLVLLGLSWRHANHLSDDLEAAKGKLAASIAAQKVQRDSIATLEGSVQSCNDSVAALKRDSDAATAAAAKAQHAAQAAAVERDQAKAILRAAPPIKNDVDAPAAHNRIRRLL